jgi:hypothetical protein
MHTISLPFVALLGLAFSVLSTSCGTALPSSMRAHRVMHAWHDDRGPGKVAIEISLTDQIAEFKRGGRDIGWCYVATGKEGHATIPGHYKITEKIADKRSNAYGWIQDGHGNVTNGDATPSTPVPAGNIYVAAPMPYWMRITNYGIGMHGGLIPQPGEPASHGCIRMPKDFVSTLFDAVEVGTPVTITREPSYHRPSPEMQQTGSQGEFIGDTRVISTRRMTAEDRQQLLPYSERSIVE